MPWILLLFSLWDCVNVECVSGAPQIGSEGSVNRGQREGCAFFSLNINANVVIGTANLAQTQNVQYIGLDRNNIPIHGPQVSLFLV